MKIVNIFLLSLSCMLLLACASVQKNTHHGEQKCIMIGQEWMYDARDEDIGSRVVIVDVFMNQQKQRVYVIRVTGVNITHPNLRNYFPDRIPYFVISEQGLAASLTTLVGEAVWNQHYDRNYQKWKSQHTGHDYFGFTIKAKIKNLAEVLDVKLGA